MKGVVLAGGKGSRLRPFTYSGAKQLVPIANTPVLHFPVRQLVDAGVTEIALVVGETADQVQAVMGDGSAFGARFTYIHQPAPLGIAHALGMAESFAAGESVILYLGDNVLVGGVSAFVERFRAASPAAALVLKQVADPRAFGVASLAGERLERIVEKPAAPPSNLAVIGVYAFGPAVFDVIRTLEPSPRGELEIADAINGLLERGLTVETSLTAEHWIDTGKMEDMLAANRIILESSAPPLAPATIRCEIRQPVAIAADAIIEDSCIGPNVAIGPGCVVRRSAIRDSIVMEQTVVEDCPGIEQSMIGRFAEVRRAPARAQLILGDHSRFEGAP
jgi:glucose-1-phosphate thymidylyltransferase